MAVFELYNPDGTLHLDLSNRIPKQLGQVDIGTAAGSIVVGGPAASDIWYYVVPRTIDPQYRGDFPSIARSGRALSWPARSSSAIGATLVFGVY